MARTIITKLGIYSECGNIAAKLESHPLSHLIRNDQQLADLAVRAQDWCDEHRITQEAAVSRVLNELLN